MKKKINLLLAIGLMILAAAAAAAVSFVIVTMRFDGLYGETLSAASKYASILEAAGYIDEKFVGETNSADLTEGAVEGMLGSLDDQWSYYVNQDELQRHMDSANNSYVGIGVTVTKETTGGPLEVTKVTRDSSAWEAGIQAGDMITHAGGANLTALTLAEAKALIVGDEGTFVQLTVKKTDGASQELTLERRTVKTLPAEGRMVGSIGYITLENFDADAAESFISEVERLLGQGAEGFVFDVRFNGGGRLDELLDILDYLLPEGVIFRTNVKGGEEEVSRSDAKCLDMPMAVLVNDGTYSAAEFFAAALQEYDWAAVVGQHTTGKGYSQSTFRLSDGTLLVLSTKEYRTPNGVSLAGEGIAPDMPVELTDEEYALLYYRQLEENADPQLQAALDIAAGLAKK